MGRPGVFFDDLHPHPPIPVPAPMGAGFPLSRVRVFTRDFERGGRFPHTKVAGSHGGFPYTKLAGQCTGPLDESGVDLRRLLLSSRLM